jgi:hypothetical protein
MPISCIPADVASASVCFCGPEDSQRAQMIYLLLQLSGLTLTPAQLAAAAAPYMGQPQDMMEAEMVYLMCAAASAAGA